MKVQTGKDIPEHEVMKVLLNKEGNLPVVYAELIRGMMRERIHSLELELAERGYSLDYINIIYVGGGALMAHDHGGKQKSVFIRFNMADEADCELYRKLAEAVGSSASLTAYVKRALEEHFSVKMEMTGRQEFHEQMVSVVREEMQAQGMKLVGALLDGIGTMNIPIRQNEVREKGTEIPDTCENLHDELRGVLDLIS